MAGKNHSPSPAPRHIYVEQMKHIYNTVSWNTTPLEGCIRFHTLRPNGQREQNPDTASKQLSQHSLLFLPEARAVSSSHMAMPFTWLCH